MEYGNFYDIAKYGNEAWRGFFSQKEIAENAYIYLCEFILSKANGKPNHTMQELCKLLKQDGSEQCLEWALQIEEEIICK